MADEVKPHELEITDELIAERNDFTPGETPEDMTPWMRPIVGGIDRLNLWVGRIACLLAVPLIFAIVFEVLSRQGFSLLSGWGRDDLARELGLGPTLWVYEISRMLAGVLFMLGAGYALMRGVHIRADFIYRTWSRERQVTVDAILYLLFFFPELLKSLYEMSAGRRAIFVRFLPLYIALVALVFLGVAYPDVVPVGAWWSSLVGATGATSIEPAVIGIIMITVMLLAIFVGFPISFTLIFLGVVFGAWGFKAKLTFYLQTFQFNATMLDDQLVAVPLFVLIFSSR